MADIFISYARDDRARIEKLAAALEAEGFSVWWDRHIAGGDEYSKDIEASLKAAGAVIVAWSPGAIASHWVRDEAVYARDCGKLIPIRLDAGDPPMGFRQVQAIEFADWNGDKSSAQFVDLLHAIRSRVASDPPPLAAAHATPAWPARLRKSLPLAAAAIAALGVIAGIALFLRGAQDEKQAAKTPSPAAISGVAVLPFSNLSVREEDAFFADGIQDELLTRLSKISALRVISRTSVAGYAGTTKKIPEIASELGVAAVLEGAVQRSGTRVRINVQLIDGATDAHLWADNYDRALTAENLFDIQSEITEAIAAALKAVLTGEEKADLATSETQNVAAYEAYIRGKILARGETAGSDDFRAAIAAFDEAIGLDPGFAGAYAAKSRSLLDLYWNFTGESALRDSARAALDKAEALAPDSAETLTALGYYRYWGFLDYPGADAYLDRALKKAPNGAEAWRAKAYVARRDGRFDDAIAALEKAQRFDPLNIQGLSESADTYATLGEFALARDLIARARTLNPGAYTVDRIESYALISEGDAEGAWKAATHLPGEVSADRFSAATLTRDPEKIRFALETWPVADRRPAYGPEVYELARAQALLMSGKSKEAARILSEIKTRMDASPNPYPRGWNTNAPYLPWDLPGLMGDLKGVRTAAKDYEKNAPRDVYAQNYLHYGLAIAFTRAGDPKTALDYLDRLAKFFGPASYLRISITPAFDPLHREKRYLALKTSYEKWAAGNRDE